jgi:uncharacterized tellurite resistance protein B-like protein
MLTGIKEFFSQFIEPGSRNEPDGERALQVATAALLLEMMRMDDRIEEAERHAIAETLRQQFDLDVRQVETLVALAGEEARQASDYYQFTSLINKSCDAGQKVRIVENMWRIAMIDGHLDAHELHLMRKIADLLYVGHADYVAAKARARESAGLPAG